MFAGDAAGRTVDKCWKAGYDSVVCERLRVSEGDTVQRALPPASNHRALLRRSGIITPTGSTIGWDVEEQNSVNWKDYKSNVNRKNKTMILGLCYGKRGGGKET